MNKIRVGILGCSSFAERVFIPNILAMEQFELIAIASRSLEKASSIASKFGIIPVHGYDNLLERDDIDCVYIPLPTGMHYEWILKSLRKNKHVFAEKSITDHFLKTEEIIKEAKLKKLCVFENFMFTYHSQMEYVQSVLESGQIGLLRQFRSSFGFPEFNAETNIRYKKELGGGALLDAGAYTLKAAALFLGPELELLCADLNNYNREVDYQGSVMLKNDAGVVAQLSFGFDNFYQNNIELWGSRGKLTVTRAFTARENHLPVVIIEKQNELKNITLPADNQMQKILIDFHNAVNLNPGQEFKPILQQSQLLTQILYNEKIR